MAIAPLDDPRGEERGLRLVRGGRPAGAAPRGIARHAASDRTLALRRSRAAHPTARALPRPTIAPVPERRAAWATASLQPMVERQIATRTATLARRRRTAGFGIVLVALVLLAMPLRALGAVTLDGRATPNGTVAGLAPGALYVVQAGDTMTSIARRVNPAAAPAIARELVASTGSSTVVPGEHVVIP
jgi:hypothetical protein